LTIPRLTTPRTQTPAGSVGIGGVQSCVYAVPSPGGFWVLGRTPLKIFDPGSDAPILLRPGDRVRFRRIDRHEYDRIAGEVERRTYRPIVT
jgi:inhibitor of KinA